MVGMARRRLAAQPESRGVLAAIPGPGKDRPALWLGEGPLRVALATDRPPPESAGGSGDNPDADGDVDARHQPAAPVWMPATSQRPPTFTIEQSSIVVTSSVLTATSAPPMIWPGQ